MKKTLITIAVTSVVTALVVVGAMRRTAHVVNNAAPNTCTDIEGKFANDRLDVDETARRVNDNKDDEAAAAREGRTPNYQKYMDDLKSAIAADNDLKADTETLVACAGKQ